MCLVDKKSDIIPWVLFLFLFFFCLFVFSRATPAAYGGSQARSLIRTAATSLHQSHSNMGSEPCYVTYSTAKGNAGSLTHWARPAMEPATAWFLVGFVNPWAMIGTPSSFLISHISPMDCPRTVECIRIRRGDQRLMFSSAMTSFCHVVSLLEMDSAQPELDQWMLLWASCSLSAFSPILILPLLWIAG